MLNGYIKLFRRFAEWEWYSDVNTKVVFLHLLLKANHKPSKYQGHYVPSGSVVTGRVSLSTELGLTEKQIRIALQKLESTGEIARKRASKFSIISLLKWDTYQATSDSEGQQRASRGPAEGQQRATSEECKNGRMEEGKNKKPRSAISFSKWPSEPSKEVLADWLRYRKSMKAEFTQTAANRMANEINQAHKSLGMSVDDCLGIAMEAGWRGFKYDWAVKRANTDSGSGGNSMQRKIKVLN